MTDERFAPTLVGRVIAETASRVTIREATRDDLPAIERLLDAATLPVAGLAGIVATHPHLVLVAVAAHPSTGDAEPVGVAALEVQCDHALLRSVAVRPEWRRHGVASRLVRHAIDRAEARGIHALYLLTVTAEHYFPRFGFHRVERAQVPAEIAETVEFTSACPATAIAMVKTLD